MRGEEAHTNGRSGRDEEEEEKEEEEEEEDGWMMGGQVKAESKIKEVCTVETSLKTELDVLWSVQRWI